MIPATPFAWKQELDDHKSLRTSLKHIATKNFHVPLVRPVYLPGNSRTSQRSVDKFSSLHAASPRGSAACRRKMLEAKRVAAEQTLAAY